MTKKGLLERLAEGPVIGDGGFVFAMEKRGYVKAGPWTPECVMSEPEAGKFLRLRKLGWAGLIIPKSESLARFVVILCKVVYSQLL